MNGERAIRPDETLAVSLPGRPSRLVARGLQHLDRPRRRLIDLGTLGGNESSANAINNRGQIVGSSQIDRRRIRHAFLWEDGQMRVLGSRVGWLSSANTVNNQGQVVCTWIDAAFHERTVLWEEGRVQALKIPGADFGLIGITDRAEGVGWGMWEHEKPGDKWLFVFAWNLKSGEFSTLRVGDEDDESFLPIAVNNSGQILGEDWLWEHDEIRKLEIRGLGLLENRTAVPRALNDHGQIVGGCSANGATVCYMYIGYEGSAFLSEHGDRVDLGLLGDDHAFSVATSINNRGQVVGWSGAGQMFPFLYEDGRIMSLEALVADDDNFARPLAHDANDMHGHHGLSINDGGQIVGTLQTKNGENHAFLCE